MVKVNRADWLSITKTAQLETDENGDKLAAQGQQVAYVLLVENKGNTTLQNVLVIDDTYDVIVKDSGGEHTVPEGQVITTIPTLIPGESESITVCFNVPETAAEGARYDNYATAKIVDEEGNDVLKDKDNDIITVERVEPKLSVIKTVNGEEKIEARLGEKVYFDITIVNTGNADAENVYITDHMLVNGETTDASWALSGESKIVNVSYTVPSNFTGKSIVNTAYADSAETGKVEATATVELRDPKIELTKTVNSTNVTAGERVYYKLVVTNTGNCTLTDVLYRTPPSDTR